MSEAVDVMRQAAAETDTFSFQIVREDEDPGLTISREAMDETARQMIAWVALRMAHIWEQTGRPPKFVKIDVKVGVE